MIDQIALAGKVSYSNPPVPEERYPGGRIHQLTDGVRSPVDRSGAGGKWVQKYD